MNTENTHLMETDNDFVQFPESGNRWNIAKDAVDYPVWILPAYYVNPVTETEEFVNANGMTSTGRDTNYCLVVVDKYRNDDRHVIASVSDSYGSLSTADVYEQLQQELVLSEQKHQVNRLYVSQNGGRQQLTIKMLDMMTIDGVPDELSMMIRLDTSVDGSRAHSLSMIVHNTEGDTDINVYGGNYNLSARHTKTISDRSAYYIPTIKTMIENWNDVVIPTMSLMYDCKFNRNVALDLIAGICTDSKMGERHTAKIRELYMSSNVVTKATDDSLYRINMTINQYVDENLADMHNTKQIFKTNVTKSIQKNLNRLKK